MMRRFFSYAKRYKKQFIIAFLCVIGETVFELIIPVLMANIIDYGVMQNNSIYIIKQGIMMAICANLRGFIFTLCS